MVCLLNERVCKQWIESVIDKDSFLPLSPLQSSTDSCHLSYAFGSEVITAFARVGGRPIAIYAHNANQKRGYISSQGAQKICRLMDRARNLKIPIVAFLASPGISLEEGLKSGDEYTQVIRKNIELSGIIPQFAVIMAPTLGAPAYSATLMDFVFFNKSRSYLMVTSPIVVRQAIGEKTTLAELGGADMHGRVTGIADFVEDTLTAQLETLKALLQFLPLSTEEKPLLATAKAPLSTLPLIPENPRMPFNMQTLIEAIVDDSYWLEYKKLFGQGMLCGFSYIQGHPVGIVANQSMRYSGAIDADAAQKSARFIRLCDAYNIPVLTFIDVPGFMPGSREEQKGLLRYGAQLCAAMQTSVPRLSVVVRKCFGAAAYLLMQSRQQGGDLVLALEAAQIGVMGKEATKTVQTVDQSTDDNVELSRSSLEEAYALGMVDEVIKLDVLRARLGAHLSLLSRKSLSISPNKKHSIDP